MWANVRALRFGAAAAAASDPWRVCLLAGRAAKGKQDAKVSSTLEGNERERE